MVNDENNEELITALDIPALAIIWFSCIEDNRTIKEIKELWKIDNRHELYKELEILREVKLVTAEKDYMTKRIPEWNIRSNLSWLAGLSLVKFIPQFDPRLMALYRISPDEIIQILVKWFFEKSPKERMNIINSDVFKKVIMKTERIIRINKKLKEIGLFAGREENIKNALVGVNYTKKEIDKGLDNLLKNRISNGRYILWYCLILIAMSKAYALDYKFRQEVEKNKNRKMNYLGANVSAEMVGIYEEIPEVVKEIKEKKYEISEEVTILNRERLNGYILELYKNHLKNLPKEFKRKLAKDLLK